MLLTFVPRGSSVDLLVVLAVIAVVAFGLAMAELRRR